MKRSINDILSRFGKWIGRCIDFFYPPFRRFFSKRFFRYGVCGVSNMGFDLLLFAVGYNFIFAKKVFDLGWIAFTPHVASLLLTFPISLMSGFLLQKYVTFSESILRGRVQLLRYVSIVALNLLINYVGLKLLVEVLGFYPTPSKFIILLVTAIVSYIFQAKFTFNVR